VRNARERLQSCDIVYAAPGDIPWKENAFDTVLMKYSGEDYYSGNLSSFDNVTFSYGIIIF